MDSIAPGDENLGGTAMSSFDDSDTLGPRLRIMQIIAGAIIAGAFIGMGMFLMLRNSVNARPAADPPVITYVGLAFAAMTLITAVVLRNRNGSAIARQMQWERESTFPTTGKDTTRPEERALVAAYQTRMLMGLAPIEGAIFFQGIAYLLEGELLSLGAACVMIVALLLQFPTRGRVERWMEKQRDKFEQDDNLP